MRPSHDAATSPSATPIYDALYAEWRRFFRALPGDRSGEEDVAFTGFGTGFRATGGSSHTGHTPPGFWFESPQRPTGQHRAHAALPPARRREG